MGQSNEVSAKNKSLPEKLKHIETDHSTHYGELQVYRLTQKPFDYYLRYRQIYQNNPHGEGVIRDNQYLYEALEGHRNIVKVDLIRTEKAISLCSDGIIMECFAKYYNYTLEKAIDNKRNANKMFKDSDLLYIFISLAEVGSRVAEHCSDLYFGLFRANKVFLSTEGFIKVYPFRINQQAAMSQLSLSDTAHSDMEASPDKQHSRIFMSDLKDIAFLITQLSLLEHKQDLEALSREHLMYRLDKGLAGRVSPRIRHLTMRLLEGEEMSWSTLKKELESIKNVESIRPSYCLRLEEDISLRQSQVMQRQHQQANFQRVERVERQQMLSALQPKLMASRIQPLSKTKQF